MIIEQIQNVPHFENLGAHFQSDGKLLLEIKRRIVVCFSKIKQTSTWMERARIKHEDDSAKNLCIPKQDLDIE